MAEIALAQQVEQTTKIAERLKELINAADYPAIEALFNKEMSDALPLEKSRAFFEGLTQQFGKIKLLDAPKLVPPAVIFPTRFERGILDMQIVLDDHDKIAGLVFKPQVTTTPAPERHRTELSLPFRGRWLVFWGGDTKALNQHHDMPNQRFAFDFLGVDEKGRTQRGESNKKGTRTTLPSVGKCSRRRTAR